MDLPSGEPRGAAFEHDSCVRRATVAGAGPDDGEKAMRSRRRSIMRPFGAMAAGLMAVVAAACVPPGGAGPNLPPGTPGGAVSCPMLPADNIWNTRVDTLPLDPLPSAAYVATIGASATMHADFGSGLWNGGPIGIRTWS